MLATHHNVAAAFLHQQVVLLVVNYYNQQYSEKVCQHCLYNFHFWKWRDSPLILHQFSYDLVQIWTNKKFVIFLFSFLPNLDMNHSCPCHTHKGIMGLNNCIIISEGVVILQWFHGTGINDSTIFQFMLMIENSRN